MTVDGWKMLDTHDRILHAVAGRAGQTEAGFANPLRGPRGVGMMTTTRVTARDGAGPAFTYWQLEVDRDLWFTGTVELVNGARTRWERSGDLPAGEGYVRYGDAFHSPWAPDPPPAEDRAVLNVSVDGRGAYLPRPFGEGAGGPALRSPRSGSS